MVFRPDLVMWPTALLHPSPTPSSSPWGTGYSRKERRKRGGEKEEKRRRRGGGGGTWKPSSSMKPCTSSANRSAGRLTWRNK